MQKLLRRIQYWFRARRIDADLSEELELHRALTQERLERGGLPPKDAFLASRRALGNVTLACEDARSVWTWSWLERLWQDVRYGARTLRKNQGFTVVAVFTLALGIGGTTAMFSVVNAVMLRPLPYANPDRLAMLWTADRKRDIHEAPTSFPTFTDWRNESRLFADMAFWRIHAGNLTGTSEAERLVGAMASANLFPLLGVSPALGRTFSADEEHRREAVVVLSHRLWQRRFGSDPSTIGRSLEIDGHRLQVIGVMPESFYFPTKDIQHWVPATLMGPWAVKPPLAERAWTNRFADLWHVAGRLTTRATVREAQAEMTLIGHRLAAAHPFSDPDVVGFGVEVVPMLEQVTGRKLQLALWILLGSVGVVLLIACVNVANLLLARGTARTREFAVRAALGAARARLVRQLLIESLMVALAAGTLGTLAAGAGIRGLATAAAPAIPRLEEVAIDPRVLAFTAAVSIVAGLLFGTLPAWRLSRGDPGHALKEGGPGAAAGPRRTRGLLVMIECMLAVALLAGAGLLIRSLLVVRSVDPGFDTRNTLLVRVNLPIPPSPEWRRREWQVFGQINDRIAGLPDVQAVGGITNFLIAANPEEAITVEGRPPVDGGPDTTLVNNEDVTPGFFQAVGVPLLRGRFFTPQEQNAPVAIVNEAFARRFFPGQDPVGKRFKEGGPGARSIWISIVGVVGDMHRQGLEQRPVPAFFFASSEPTMDIAVRRSSDPADLGPSVREAIRSVYRDAMITSITTVEQSLGGLGAQRRFQTWLLSVFALVALVLAAVGIYGIVHFTVVQRRHELGVRIALGARSRDLRRLVLIEGMRLPIAGLTIGLLGASGMTRALSHFLFEVSPTDPITFLVVALLLVVTALVASWLPARRAARVDPVVALRCE